MAEWWLNDASRFDERGDLANWTRALELEVATGAPKRQSTRQVAVEAGQSSRRRVLVRIGRASRPIDEGQQNVGAFVGAPATRASLRDPEQPLTVSARVRSVAGSHRSVERTEVERTFGLGRDRRNSVHGEDLRRQATARVGDDLILRLPLREQHRLRHVRKQVHDRRAAEPERRLRDAGFEHRTPLGALVAADRNEDLDRASHPRRFDLVEAGEVEEEILLGEDEIFLKQPVRLERTTRIWKHAFVAPETTRLQRRCRKRDHLRRAGRSRLAYDDLPSARVEQFVKRRREISFAVDVEAQRLEVELR